MADQQRLVGNAVETYQFPGYQCSKCGSTDTPEGEIGKTNCAGIACCICMCLSVICICCAWCPLLTCRNCYTKCSNCGHKEEAKAFSYTKVSGGKTTSIKKGF